MNKKIIQIDPNKGFKIEKATIKGFKIEKATIDLRACGKIEKATIDLRACGAPVSE